MSQFLPRNLRASELSSAFRKRGAEDAGQATRERRSLSWIGFLLALLGSSCGPGGATPMPEPPAAAVELAKVKPDVGVIISQTWPQPVPIAGEPGAVSAGAVVRVTNLETVNPPVATTADADGSFRLTVEGSPGDEFRFQALSGNQRSAPRDARLSNDVLNFTSIERPSCIALQPGLEVSAPSASSALLELQIRNTCEAELTLSNPRARLNLPAFVVESQFPLSIPKADSATLQVRFSAGNSGASEEILFFDATLGTESHRYPITLYAVAP